MPLSVGEFGPVYQNAEDGKPDWEHINDTRFQVLEKQLEIYDREQASWSIWLYKGQCPETRLGSHTVDRPQTLVSRA